MLVDGSFDAVTKKIHRVRIVQIFVCFIVQGIVFKNGAHCYNGPKRSVRVLLECGAETEFIKVDEVRQNNIKF